MNFHSNLKQEMYTKKVFSYEFEEHEEDDDVFYCELRRQVVGF